jgi:hypothetical protein
VGASWEGFAVEQIINRIQARPEECYFWSTYSGAELDLLVVRGRRRIGFEIKRTVSPKITPSMRQALRDLRLQRIEVIHAGEDTFPLEEKIRAVSLSRILTDLDVLGWFNRPYSTSDKILRSAGRIFNAATSLWAGDWKETYNSINYVRQEVRHMATKLTLRLDEGLIRDAKREGASVCLKWCLAISGPSARERQSR